jgi:glycosyltransferase involved in cell wall biosynthesis
MTVSVPRMTVIVPVHNSRDHLPALFLRLEEPSVSGFQVVLVDDGSTDGSGAMLAAHAGAHPGTELITVPVSRGVAHARNTGLRAARGQYVWFVDDDDVWARDAIPRLLHAAERAEADLVVCRAELRYLPSLPGRVIDGIGDERIVGRSDAWQMLLDGVVNGYLWNKLFLRTTLGVDPFDALSSQSDFTGVARAVARSEKVHFIPDVLYFHLVREGSITRRRDPNLANLQRAYDLAVSLHTDVMERELDSSVEYFRAWFLVVPFGNTPTRVRASWSVRREGILRARAAARGINMSKLRARSPRIQLSTWAITRLGGLYLVALHSGQAAKRVMRKVGPK